MITQTVADSKDECDERHNRQNHKIAEGNTLEAHPVHCKFVKRNAGKLYEPDKVSLRFGKVLNRQLPKLVPQKPLGFYKKSPQFHIHNLSE